jgi:prevent-host-death family protein
MKRVKIADLKNHLSRHLREVEHGAEIEVTDRRRPIARLVPSGASESEVRIIPARRSFAEVRNRRARKARWRIDSLQFLLQERGQR